MWRHVQPYLGRPKPAILHWTPDHLHLSLKQAEPCFFLDAKKVFSLPKPDQSTSTTLWEERNREFNLNTQGNVSETNLLTTFILATELLNCERTTTAAVWYADTVMWFWKSLVINLFSHSGARTCWQSAPMISTWRSWRGWNLLQSCRVVDNSLWALQCTSHTHLIYFHKYKLSVTPLCCSLAVWFMKAGVRFFCTNLSASRSFKQTASVKKRPAKHSTSTSSFSAPPPPPQLSIWTASNKQLKKKKRNRWVILLLSYVTTEIQRRR